MDVPSQGSMPVVAHVHARGSARRRHPPNRGWCPLHNGWPGPQINRLSNFPNKMLIVYPKKLITKDHPAVFLAFGSRKCLLNWVPDGALAVGEADVPLHVRCGDVLHTR